jgi:hypothetical protein
VFVLYLAGLAVFIVALTRLSLRVRPPKHDKEQDWYRDRESYKRQRNHDHASIGTLASRIDAIGDELYAQRRQQHHHENSRALLEKLGLGAASLAVILAGASAYIFQLQLRAARETLTATERPWVYVSDDVLPKVVEGNKISRYSVDLVNKGDSLATDISVGGKIVNLHETGYLQELADTSTVPCEPPSNVPMTPRIRAIPPKGRAEGFLFLVSTSLGLLRAPAPDRWTHQYLEGCIRYKWPTSDDTFRTYFLVPVVRNQSENSFDPVGELTYVDLK